ncbi:MAG: sodium:solute symporter family protein [Candidatus Eisenbacteria bacterium]|nr:sodium:solute symporter family protein [Candidatus Eisenbacteria bacterium]
MTSVHGQLIDYVIVAAYFAGILAFGSFFSRYTKSTHDFFLSGRRFSWWLIAFSCIATTVGSYSFIKYSAAGFQYGLSSGMTYFNDWFIMPLFLLGWIPIIYFARVVSIPEYLERRFDRPTRLIALLFIMVYTIGYIGINLYTMGVAMHAIIPGLTEFQWAMVIAGVTAVYVAFGGQTAVIMTDLVQGVLLLVAGLVLGGLCIGYLGRHNGQGLSGIAAFWQGLPDGHRLPFSGFSTPEKFPMVGVFWQDLFGASMFYYFGNQGLILRFLSVKSVPEGRKAAVAVMVVLVPLAAIAVSVAGWGGRSLQTFGLLPPGADPNQIFVIVMDLVARPGMFGFILAALTAALMSTIDTLINAVASLVVNDFLRPLVAPGRSDRSYLSFARAASVLTAIVGLALVPLFMRFDSIYVAHASFTAAISPPMVVTVIAGLMWPRFSARAARTTLLAGGLIMAFSIWQPAVIAPFAFLHGMGRGQGLTYMRALFGFAACALLAGGATVCWPERDRARIRGLWIGTIADAKRRFKGGEPGDRHAGKRVRLRFSPESPGEVTRIEDEELPVARVGAGTAALLAAQDGDRVYVSDPRWWLGGLNSFHAILRVNPELQGVLAAPESCARNAHFSPSRPITVEKII